MPRVSEVFSPSLTKVPSTSLGCGLAVKQVAYGKSGFLLPALHLVFLVIFDSFCIMAVRLYELDGFSMKILYYFHLDYKPGEGMEWIFDEDTGVVVIRGNGPMPDFGRFLKDRVLGGTSR